MAAIPREKEFIIRHIVNNASRITEDEGPVEVRYNIPWHMSVYITKWRADMYLHCPLENGPPGWSIDADYEVKFVGKRKSYGIKGHAKFKNYSDYDMCQTCWEDMKPYTINDKLKIEWRVKINKMIGFENSEKNKNSEVVLVVGDEQFKVDKEFLACNSTYFENLFFVEEGGKSIIQTDQFLDAENFQNFLKILKEEQNVDENSVNQFLELSIKLGSKSVMGKCEKFLMEKSEKSIKIKFNTAIKYKLNKLKKKCLSDIKSKADLAEIASENARHFDASVWKELLQKSISMN
ncbi:hypothetical protein B9Z55_006906 [Caenorhabditis nigoni]|uniref:BTB domain-containing protein n=2 Tax=Caenorhabditis nigoni TaxID=1611254 RepID=A0A2G5V7T9_9PELO|nr:hypothetical protein B9Z55_006906 [Caenorhabditis nigoni]